MRAADGRVVTQHADKAEWDNLAATMGATVSIDPSLSHVSVAIKDGVEIGRYSRIHSLGEMWHEAD